MTEIAGMPILWHVMKIYSNFGINDFIICCGYKGFVIKEYFKNYSLHMSDVTISLVQNDMTVHRDTSEPWNITLINTGEFTMTGGRLKRVEKYIDGTFFLTYGDGLANVNIKNLLEFHQKNKKMVTMTAVKPTARFGEIKIQKNTHNVSSFREKPSDENDWINGGFFVFDPDFFDYLNDEKTILEHEPLQKASIDNQLIAYKHKGFWQCMDNKKDYDYLNNLWEENKQYWFYPQCITNVSDENYFNDLQTNKKELYLNLKNAIS